jgi:selenophosphate synthetase-related protein
LTELIEIVQLLRSFDGITRKYVLPRIIRKLREKSYKGDTPHSLGEDSAAIGTDSDEIVLLTTDAIVEDLCLHHPKAAGFNVVLANVMDIYAAGGRPTSFAVALSYADEGVGDEILEGLIEGSHTFQVPVVRGHTNSQSSSTYIVGSATGTVKQKNLLTSGGASEGDSLLLIFDPTGKRGSSYQLGWDTVTDRDPATVVARLSVMTHLAEEGLLNASKDVSVAGLVGTASMLVEYSGIGGVIDLDSVDATRPRSISLVDWIRMFISLGFLAAAPPENIEEIASVAKQHGMTVARVGIVDSSRTLVLQKDGKKEILFDFSSGPIITPRNLEN